MPSSSVPPSGKRLGVPAAKKWMRLKGRNRSHGASLDFLMRGLEIRLGERLRPDCSRPPSRGHSVSDTLLLSSAAGVKSRSGLLERPVMNFRAFRKVLLIELAERGFNLKLKKRTPRGNASIPRGVQQQGLGPYGPSFNSLSVSISIDAASRCSQKRQNRGSSTAMPPVPGRRLGLGPRRCRRTQ